MRKLLNVGEVAEEFGIPAGTLYFYRHKGIGPTSYRLGRRVVYDRPDVEAWVAAQKLATRSGGPSAA